MAVDGTAIDAIANLVRKPFELGGMHYYPKDWTVEDPAALVKHGPKAAALVVSTLGALRDYLTANRDALDLSRTVVHVSSPTTVSVVGPLDSRTRAREFLLTAQAHDATGDGFMGRFHSIEEFIVALQVRFDPSGDRARLLQLLGNVKHETVKTSIDDGVTQTVQARAGVALVSDVAVPNPVTLTAYRTFRDVAQAPALFALRVQGSRHGGGLPEVGLFEADGGAWKLTAIEAIKAWLTPALPETVSILG